MGKQYACHDLCVPIWLYKIDLNKNLSKYLCNLNAKSVLLIHDLTIDTFVGNKRLKASIDFHVVSFTRGTGKLMLAARDFQSMTAVFSNAFVMPTLTIFSTLIYYICSYYVTFFYLTSSLYLFDLRSMWCKQFHINVNGNFAR